MYGRHIFDLISQKCLERAIPVLNIDIVCILFFVLDLTFAELVSKVENLN